MEHYTVNILNQNYANNCISILITHILTRDTSLFETMFNFAESVYWTDWPLTNQPGRQRKKCSKYYYRGSINNSNKNEKTLLTSYNNDYYWLTRKTDKNSLSLSNKRMKANSPQISNWAVLLKYEWWKKSSITAQRRGVSWYE